MPTREGWPSTTPVTPTSTCKRIPARRRLRPGNLIRSGEASNPDSKWPTKSRKAFAWDCMPAKVMPGRRRFGALSTTQTTTNRHSARIAPISMPSSLPPPTFTLECTHRRRRCGADLKGRKSFTLNADVGGTIIEVDPSGLYVFGNNQGIFDLTQPIDIPISGVGTARAALPLPAVNGAPNAPGSGVLHGEYVGEVLRLDTDVEKLVPVIGGILHNSIPPLLTPYDLAHIGLAPKISLYQDLTLTPDPRVRLKFSEIVRVGSSLTNVVEFPLGQHIQWTPIFSNSNQITVVPEYIMHNSFRHETGLALDVDVTFDALGFDSPLLPNYVGPLVHETNTFAIGRLPLYEPDPWEIEMKSVVGSGIPVTKYNADFIHDVQLTSASLISGSANTPSTFELHFQRSFVGQPPHQFQTTIPGFYTKFDVADPSGGEAYITHVFTANDDVIFIDPVTGDQFNLGRDFGLYDSTNLSSLLPSPSPTLLVADPSNPGQYLPPLSIPYLDAIPYTPPDIANDPILGAPTHDQTQNSTASRLRSCRRRSAEWSFHYRPRPVDRSRS